jgi:hypothetical protein
MGGSQMRHASHDPGRLLREKRGAVVSALEVVNNGHRAKRSVMQM